MTEVVVHDQRPAGGAVVVLPQPGRQPVEVEEPRSLLVATKRAIVQFRELVLGIRCCHFLNFSTGRLGHSTKQCREKRSIRGCALGAAGVSAQSKKGKVRLVELSTTVPTRQANNLKVYRVKQYAKSERW